MAISHQEYSCSGGVKQVRNGEINPPGNVRNPRKSPMLGDIVALLRRLFQEHFLLVLASQVMRGLSTLRRVESSLRLMINVAQSGSYSALNPLFLIQQ